MELLSHNEYDWNAGDLLVQSPVFCDYQVNGKLQHPPVQVVIQTFQE